MKSSFYLILLLILVSACKQSNGPADQVPAKKGRAVPALKLADGSELDFEQIEFAHRGGYYEGLENTLPTIAHSLTNGAHGIEVDISITADSQLILFHDHGPKRLLNTESDEDIETFTLEELNAFGFREGEPGTPVSTLAGLFALLDSLNRTQNLRTKLQLDTKVSSTYSPFFARELAKLMDKYSGDPDYRMADQAFVTSFYPHTLAAVHEVNQSRTPENSILSGLSVNGGAQEQRALAKLAVALAPVLTKKYCCSIIEADKCLVTEKYVNRWHKRGMKVISYTVNSESDKQRLSAYHIALATNCPGTSCPEDANDMLGIYKWCKEAADLADDPAIEDEMEKASPEVLLEKEQELVKKL
ncbi:MAG: glycerophosphodiester phosphodiesterase [Bacteroidia bacterium]|nr:glycerophosphodiester phosphodiesterase [Bacteroidia bacterium]